eukprot:6094618-Amphidinium_carterae.1
MQDIDDDLQSIIDAQTEERERWEQENMDGQERFARHQMRTIQDQWNEEGRLAEPRGSRDLKFKARFNCVYQPNVPLMTGMSCFTVAPPK